MPIPIAETLREYYPTLVKIVARTSWLPNKATVEQVGGAVFPTSRNKRLHPRLSPIEKDGAVVGMYDDNATPEWAIFWSHGLQGIRHKGWTIAHVWPASDDANCYTNLANLAMVPEALSSLTDKNGPLTEYLRWHAWRVYGWKPAHKNEPTKPEGYDGIEWRYLASVDEPRALIRQRFNKLDNQRTRFLRPIMERRNML